ncbi:aspartyl-phosphate phosphatase Spo0E family protein [Candidatus Clostridium radicumherbarum]|uniref:Aspartyl-phosphate phosphatase Spo0E family protein n=1 Tax=Candidatus Clostridium radicumherbarum TaxID=3381662 RepID=A0ABW8TRR9_9CLOT
MSETNEIENLRTKLNSMISTKEIITNDSELLTLSIELDEKINTFMYKENDRK